MTGSFPVSTEGEVAVVELGANLGVANVQFLHEALSQGFGQGKGVRLQAGAVEKISTAAIQVMLALGCALEERGEQLRVEQASAALKQGFLDLGLASEFERWAA